MTPDQAIADVRRIPVVLATANVAPALEKCKEVVRRDIAENFAAAAAPDGSSWPPRKPRKDDDGHPLLNDTGFLKAAALGLGPGGFDDVQGREVVIGIDKAVDLGGIPGAQAHDRGEPSRNLPQRHFYAAQEDGLAECGEIIGDAVYAELMK